jgi:MazG family protein
MKEFDEFIAIVQRLRKECPWDREQTHESLRHSFIEEVYETIESIDHAQWNELQSELGDVLLHIGLQAVIAEERGEFTLAQVIQSINEKLIRRHTHIFGDASIPDLSTQKQRWEKVKLSEGRTSLVDGVPKEMPALLRAKRLQEKAAKAGFDWNNRKDVWIKVCEEIGELEESVNKEETEKIEEEFGDLLFSLVNYSRFIHVNPEHALRRTCEKFYRRFQYIETEVRKEGKDIYSMTLSELDRYWDRSKTDPAVSS